MRPAWSPGRSALPATRRGATGGRVESPAGAWTGFAPSSSRPDRPGRQRGLRGGLKGIDHCVRWELQTFGSARGVRVSQLIAPMFDAFLRDVFVPLCAGGTLRVAPTTHEGLDGAPPS